MHFSIPTKIISNLFSEYKYFNDVMAPKNPTTEKSTEFNSESKADIDFICPTDPARKFKICKVLYLSLTAGQLFELSDNY